MSRYGKLKCICAAIAVISSVMSQNVYAEWKYENNRYMYSKDGEYLTGWNHLDYTTSYDGESTEENDSSHKKAWYYFDDNGYMQTDRWVKTGDKWYYLKNDGSMAADCTVNGYALGSDGAWIENGGWKKDSTGWWYSYGSAGYAIGWKKLDDSWYYFDSRGYMQTGWVKSGSKWYYLYDNGAMAEDTVIDGYIIDDDGTWIEEIGKINHTEDLVIVPERKEYSGYETIKCYVINNTDEILTYEVLPAQMQAYENGEWVDLTNIKYEKALEYAKEHPEICNDRLWKSMGKLYKYSVKFEDFKGIDYADGGKYRIKFDAMKDNESSPCTSFSQEFELLPGLV